MKTLLIGIVLTCSLGCMASTAQMDGNELVTKCREVWREAKSDITTKEMMDATFCFGYIAGVLDVLRLWNATNVKHFCIPEDVTNGQLHKVIKKWLDNNPEKLHWRADIIINNALIDGFPCH